MIAGRVDPSTLETQPLFAAGLGMKKIMQLDPPSCLRRMVELVVMKPPPAIDPRYQHKKQFRLLLDRKLAKAKSGGDSMSALACCHSNVHACMYTRPNSSPARRHADQQGASASGCCCSLAHSAASDHPR